MLGSTFVPTFGQSNFNSDVVTARISFAFVAFLSLAGDKSVGPPTFFFS